ncbi:phosphatase [Angustibacter aerolatus]
MSAQPGPPSVPVPSRDELREHLVRSRIAGEVATPRENNLRNYRRLADGEPYAWLGLTPHRGWTEQEVLELMVDRVGVDPDPAHRWGQDRIDPDLTIDRLEALADRVALAAQRRERVLVATGHPVGLRPTHSATAAALAAAGCTMLQAAHGWQQPEDTAYGWQDGALTWRDGVGMLAGPGSQTHHTHSPLPVWAVLDGLREAGEAPPDLVVADHGWAGGAAARGLDAVGYADCNDPALFVGEAEGELLVAVPLDDNVRESLYAPMTAYLLDRAGLAG